MHLPVLQPALQLHLIISINFMGACDREIWMGGIFPSLIFQHKSACTACPVLRLTKYSLTAYLFTKSHIAECIKSLIWLSIIERNKSNTVVHIVTVPGFSSTVPPSVTNLPLPSSTDSHVVNNLPGTSSTVSTVVNSLSGTSSTVVPVVNSLTSPSRTVSLVLQYCFSCCYHPPWPIQLCCSCC